VRDALRRVPPLETALITIAIAVLVTLAMLGRDRVTPPALDSYSSYDAATGGYRALYELLEREGVRVGRFEERTAFLDPSIDTLIYAEPLDFDPRQIASTKGDALALEDWVRRGGHLFYLGFDDTAARQKILALPYSTPSRSGSARYAIDPSLRAQGVADLGRVPAGDRWNVASRSIRTLFNDGQGAVIVRYPFGRGTVTAVIDRTLLANEHLVAADWPRLAVALGSPRVGGLVAFDETIHGHLTPAHWWQVVPRPFVIALAIASVVLLVALAGATIRLGPPLVPPARDDLGSSAFIDATSALLERGNGASAMTERAVASTVRLVTTALGAAGGSPADRDGARIENPQARSAFREMLFLANTGATDSRSFVRVVALAQRLRKEFAPHGR